MDSLSRLIQGSSGPLKYIPLLKPSAMAINLPLVPMIIGIPARSVQLGKKYHEGLWIPSPGCTGARPR